MGKRVRIATRGSELALWQARWVASRLEELGAATSLVTVETQGDREQASFAAMQGQGFFTKAIQEALLAGSADVAVHSLKDLPTAPVPGLVLAAIPKREDPREVLLIHPEAFDQEAKTLPVRYGARLGSSAVRRQAQLAQIRPDLIRCELRGNVPTRVEKLRRGEYEAILLAAAGLRRLGLDLSELEEIVLEPAQLLPAPGQGALALECRENDLEVTRLIARLDDPHARATVSAERLLMARLQGGCQLALGAHASMEGGRLSLSAWFGGSVYQGCGTGAEQVAEQVYQQLLADHPSAAGPKKVGA
ncbi:MAG: hydroxymethylbilane synthase [Deinococcus sp.]|nr:hydroxymethylbilane synthase [Deinococcus sp.]